MSTEQAALHLKKGMNITIAEDDHDAKRIAKRKDMAFALHDIREHFYREKKRSDGNAYSDVMEAIFYEILSDHGIDLDDLLQ